ncbi:efflux RND transporter permease subunit [Breznakiella homolactica]|uniref:Efflux RND transporter permease subunit n=1 Tax=Breznakiella homolactica TaxID=2798577 RepID=A0A7T7XRI0_9SPIR|nr:efflux RND transporter permease subunit [Breznakiella homolactica]QQO11107.1 efflux RND transporter permease subunit [Breznakiella homolactica]
MNIPKYSVRRPVTIVVVYALAMGIAATMVPRLAVDLYPSTARPVISVFTSFTGAGPADVEQNVTDPLEKALSSINGLKEMTSNSSFESSSISLYFDYGTDMDKTMNDVQTVANRISASLPDGAGAPIARRFDMSAMPIMRLVVRGNYPPDQLRLFAEDEIQSSIERIDGVASADVTGGTTQIVKVGVSLNRLAAFDLTFSDISNVLRGQNVLSSGGSLVRGVRDYQILTRQELNTIEDVKRLVVKTVGTTQADVSAQANRSQVVRLEDIADITLGYDDNSTRVYVNGETGVYIQVQSESDSNSVQVAARVRDALADINAELPRGITLEVLSDDTTLINATLNQVYSNALQGALLAMIILFIFLRNIKATLIIGISIPISILLTLMFMSVFGFSLNLLSLTGLILGLGMIVDGSIVILENIHNYRERGAKPDIAAILGSQEMTRAIMTSTVTTLCVFIPLIIYRNDLEMMGQMFQDLIFTVVISLSVSLVVAVTVVPALAGPIMRLDTRRQKPLKNKFMKMIDEGAERFFRSLENGYKKALDYCLDHRVLILLFVAVLLAISLLQFDGMGMNLFVRSRTDDSITVNITMPQGTTMEATEAILLDLEDIIKQEVQGYNNIILTVRRGGRTTNQGSVQVTLPPPAMQIDTPTTIVEKLTPYTSRIPGVQAAYRAGRAMSTTSAVEIAVSSRDNDALMDAAEEIKNIVMRYLPEIENPEVNLSEGGPQLQIEVNRDRAAALGISVSSIATEIRTAINGATPSEIIIGDRRIDIKVQLRDNDRRGIENLDALFVIGRSGDRISLSNVARIVENRAPSSIRREDRERVVRVTGDLPQGMAATEMQQRLENTVQYYLVPREGVTVRYLGEAEEIQQYNRRFLFIIAVAIFLVFGVMASQFESFVDPLIIFFSIPLLLIGVIWIYKISNEPFSVFSAVGVIALVGVVVNNGIVLVDYTNTLRARGLLVRDACMEAGRHRLRPILMTSLTTILGMVPIAFFPGEGADTIQPIGKTFVGGLTVSSFMTLFVTPVLYSLLNSRHDRKLKRPGQPQSEKEEKHETAEAPAADPSA